MTDLSYLYVIGAESYSGIIMIKAMLKLQKC